MPVCWSAAARTCRQGCHGCVSRVGSCVHGDRLPAAGCRRGNPGGEPCPDRRGEQIGVDGLQQPADHRLGGSPVRVDSQQHRGVGGQVGDPLGDRGAGAVAGHHRADRRGEHHDQTMADATARAWIGHRSQRRGQAGRQLRQVESGR